MMQAPQPMHSSGSTQTMPSSRFCVAPVGHTRRQLGFSQCWHWIGMNSRMQLGKVPPALSLARAPFTTAVPKEPSQSWSVLVYTTL